MSKFALNKTHTFDLLDDGHFAAFGGEIKRPRTIEFWGTWYPCPDLESPDGLQIEANLIVRTSQDIPEMLPIRDIPRLHWEQADIITHVQSWSNADRD